MKHTGQAVNFDLKDMSLKGRLFFLVTFTKMFSRSTCYIAFMANIIVNTFIMFKSIQSRDYV